MSGGILTRSQLAMVFPDHPRMRAQMEELDVLLGDASDRTQTARALLGALIADLGDGGRFQTAAAILDQIASLPNKVGALAIDNDGGAAIRPIDGQDPASLLSRGSAYGLFVGIAGKGATADRPVLPDGAAAIYFDTDLAADGKPIFWQGANWVDSTGTIV